VENGEETVARAGASIPVATVPAGAFGHPGLESNKRLSRTKSQKTIRRIGYRRIRSREGIT
jgi:hypothetical protein